MKVKHTKLKKSIFLILICISLTTTFVVSASAVVVDRTITLNYPGGSISFPFEFSDDYGYDQFFEVVYYPFGLVDEGVPANTSILIFSFGGDLGFSNYPLSPIIFSGVVDSYSFKIPFSSIEHLSVPLVYEDSSEGFLYSSFTLPFDYGENYIITFNSSSSPSFTDSVGSGLTSSLTWVGQVFESLTTGPIRPLLECFAVTISVSAVLLGIYSIRRFIWGS